MVHTLLGMVEVHCHTRYGRGTLPPLHLPLQQRNDQYDVYDEPELTIEEITFEESDPETEESKDDSGTPSQQSAEATVFSSLAQEIHEEDRNTVEELLTLAEQTPQSRLRQVYEYMSEVLYSGDRTVELPDSNNRPESFDSVTNVFLGESSIPSLDSFHERLVRFVEEGNLTQDIATRLVAFLQKTD